MLPGRGTPDLRRDILPRRNNKPAVSARYASLTARPDHPTWPFKWSVCPGGWEKNRLRHYVRRVEYSEGRGQLRCQGNRCRHKRENRFTGRIARPGSPLREKISCRRIRKEGEKCCHSDGVTACLALILSCVPLLQNFIYRANTLFFEDIPSVLLPKNYRTGSRLSTITSSRTHHHGCCPKSPAGKEPPAA